MAEEYGQGAGTIGDLLVRRLSEWGLERIYGHTGDGINGILAALDHFALRFAFDTA